MAEQTAFDTLVLELGPQERSELLSRLSRATTVSSEPLRILRADDERHIDYAAAYRELGFFSRLIISVLSMVRGKDKDELVRDRFLRSLAREAESAAPGLADAKRRVFLEPFVEELRALKLAARYFYDLLDKTLEKNRAQFFAFLASLRFERTHQELETEADPFIYADRNRLADDNDVRIAVASAFESALGRMEEDHRRAMLQDVRNLQCLKKLSGFLFDRMLNAFHPGPSGRRELSFYTVNEQLFDLATLLSSLEPPSIKLMEAILAFDVGERVADKSFDIEELVKNELAEASKALAAIRSFNARVPLLSYLRLLNEDPNWSCPRFSGGEDWFALYRSYWKERIDRRYQRFVADRRIKRLESDIAALVGQEEQSWLENIVEEGAESTPPARFYRPLRFLEAFYHRVFLAELNRYLKLVLLEGEFYKRDNRIDYTDAYNGLLQIGESLKNLDRRLASDGELGLSYFRAKNELIPLQIKRRKVESTVQAADTEAEAILRRAGDSMLKMQLILKGILAGEAHSRYDSLSNLSSIEGKANKDFQRGLSTVKDKLEKAAFLLGELTRSSLGGDLV